MFLLPNICHHKPGRPLQQKILQLCHRYKWLQTFFGKSKQNIRTTSAIMDSYQRKQTAFQWVKPNKNIQKNTSDNKTHSLITVCVLLNSVFSVSGLFQLSRPRSPNLSQGAGSRLQSSPSTRPSPDSSKWEQVVLLPLLDTCCKGLLLRTGLGCVGLKIRCLRQRRLRGSPAP